MPPEVNPWNQLKQVFYKETSLFFSSPVAYLFLLCYAGVSLFTVFWGESFFARNIADVRPLFEWMPLFLIFLCSAVTMRLWSEERRTGTLESVLTSPAPLWTFVVGKFLACLFLLACALVLTVGFPLTVSALGDLDWGPVSAGYLATLVLGATYLALGLLVSSQTQNPIISLLGSVVLGGGLYFLGSPKLTALAGEPAAQWLRLLGTGSRFESITRGVIDFRDLGYYFGLTLVFLTLNAYFLERQRWSKSGASVRRSDWRTVAALIAANALGLNLWLGQLPWFRLDVTEGRQYSLSSATVRQIENLNEPLTIKAYFSRKTHPLLAPLVPQIKDLLREYQARSKGQILVEFIDPQSDPKAEEQAKGEFGIEPVPFQITDRYQASIVSSYFNIVVKYGDSHEILGFKDLIEVKTRAAEGLDVQLRNPEYDITRAVKKVVDRYQRGGKIWHLVNQPVTLELFVSEPDRLPQGLKDFRTTLESKVRKFTEESEGKLSVKWLDPDRDSQARESAQRYGLKAMAQNFIDPNSFYFYLVLGQGEKLIQIPLDDLSEAAFERNFNAALQRFATGFSKTLAVHTRDGNTPTLLQEFLGDDLNIESEDLSDGTVNGQAEALLLLAPEDLSGKELYALDQFLMRGGAVIACTSPYLADLGSGELSLTESKSGLDEWLKHYGIAIAKELILDARCAALPIPITRYVGGYPVREIRMLDYPYLLDIREEGFAEKHPALSDLNQVIMPWASPLKFEKTDDGKAMPQTLLRSSPKSWTSASLNVNPLLDESGQAIFAPGGAQTSETVAAVVSGALSSYFTGEESKKLASDVEGIASAVITSSPESAKLIVLSAPMMFDDTVTRLFGSIGSGDTYGNLSFLGNLVDWATEDDSLLGIRARSHFKRTLYPVERGEQVVWEYLNYLSSLVLLGAMGLAARYLNYRRRSRYFSLTES